MSFTISALNRLRPLSGNSFLRFFLVLLFFSCSSARHVSYQQPAPVENKAVPQSKNLPDKEQTHINTSGVSKHENEFTIGLLLPFLGSKVYINDLSQSSYFFPEESQLAVEYYQGAMLAIDSLQHLGLRVKVLVCDVGSDTMVLKTRLLNPELKKADLLIGPVNITGLKLAADFSLKNNIYLVSPFSTTAIQKNSNPYYILANATLRSHCEKVYDYISKHEEPRKIFMLYRKKDADLEIVQYFKEYRSSLPTEDSIQIEDLTDSTEKKYYQIKNLLSDTQKNIIVIASNDEPFVRTVMKQLSGLSEVYLIKVFGMPTWNNFDLIPLEQFEKTNTYITKHYWLNKESIPARQFKDAYFRKYNVNPTENSIRGYDQLMYFGNILLNAGDSLAQGFNKITSEELAEGFSILPVYTSTEQASIKYWENKEVYLLKFENGEWKKTPY